MATNLPGWAMLDSLTGEISGEATSADVGTYAGIRLTVQGGGESSTSSPWTIEVVAAALGAATLSWTPPTQRTDGRSLDGDLAGYKVYFGQSSNNLDQVVTIASPGTSSHVIDQLTPATWYFTITAYDNLGLESSFSNIASKTID